jgi:uncharacterized membrane protein
MTTGRLEAFSDGVIAILITIMVLELKVPAEPSWGALATSAQTLWTYALSFVFLGIYWNNHHHFFHLVHRVNGAVLWANLHLLFWLSLVPFVTEWMRHHVAAPLPTAAYGIVLLLSAVAWIIMQSVVVPLQGPQSRLAEALGRDVKGKLSLAVYVAAIPLAFVRVWIADVLYGVVALMWLVPDRRIESLVHDRPAQ